MTKYHTTKEGKKVALENMATMHIINTMLKIEKQAKDSRSDSTDVLRDVSALGYLDYVQELVRRGKRDEQG